MNLTKISSLLVAGMLSVSTVGCNNSSNTEVEETKNQVEQSSNINLQEEKEVVDEMVLSDEYTEIEITGVEITKDYEGKDALIVKYNYTNKREEPNSAMINVYMQAFQNGKEIENFTMIMDNEYNEQIDIMKGITQEDCWYTFVLEDTSEVTLFVQTDILFGEKTEYIVRLDDMTINRK